MDDQSLSWAINILSGTPFRIFLIIVLIINLLRFLFRRISLMYFVQIGAGLFVIAFIPQILTFLQKFLATHFI